MLGGKFQMKITHAIVIWRKRNTPAISERGILDHISTLGTQNTLPTFNKVRTTLPQLVV